MSLIQRLVEWRLDKFLIEFDINIEDFNFMLKDKVRLQSWKKLQQRMVNYNTGKCSYTCYFVILNIIWKNIIKFDYYDLDNEHRFHIHMLYTNYRDRVLNKKKSIASLNRKFLLCKKIYALESNENSDIIQKRIINYIFLIDQFSTEKLILDLVKKIKMCMLDIMLLY